MKKLLLVLISILCLGCSLMFVGCGDTSANNEDPIKQVYYTYVAYAEGKGETPLSYEDWLASIKGEKGDKGDKGDTGENGVTPSIEISDEGYWIINGVKTGYKAVAKDGVNGVTPTIEISSDGCWIINGVKTGYKAIAQDGTNGVDGKTPTIEISPDGYWVINGVKTENKAIGIDGADGTNGTNGIDGKTPTIEISPDGYWVINGVKTENKAIGIDGVDGTNGTNGIDGKTPTIEISPDGYWVINGVKTEYKAVVEEKHEHDFSNGDCTCGEEYYSEGLKYLISEDGEYYILIGRGTCSDREIVIPSYYKGKPVKEIGLKEGDDHFVREYGFYNDMLTGIVIPDTVTSIGKCAFCDSKNLTSITIPDSVIHMSEGALTDSGLLIIYCQAKEQPSSWDSDWNDNTPVVWDCDNNLVADDGNIYAIVDKFLYGIKDDKAEVSGFLGTSTTANIPSSINYKGQTYSVTSIGDGVFSYCESLTSIEIPNSVTSIGDYAFEYCKSLTSIEIPDSITSIGDRAFYWCTSLTSIEVAEENENYKDIDGNLYNKEGATLIQYAIGKTDTSFVIPNSVTNIGGYAFYNCYYLTSIEIPDGVTSIDDYAIYGCYNFRKVYYKGNAEGWGKIIIGEENNRITNETRYYYIENESDLPDDGGNYWHYVDGVPTVWTKE